MIEPVNQEFSTLAKRTPEEFKFVKLRSDGGVVRMTLNRPEHNLLNEAMLREMADGIGYAGERDDIKLIVLDSACKVFCGGIDVGEYTSQRLFQMIDAFKDNFAGILERALELGMVNRLVPETQLEKTVADLVNRINSHSGPVLTMAKKAILGGMGMSLRDGLKHSMNIFLNELYRLEDSQEGLRALVEKRKPNWKNR